MRCRESKAEREKSPVVIGRGYQLEIGWPGKSSLRPEGGEDLSRADIWRVKGPG